MRSRKNAYRQGLEVRLQEAKQAESVPTSAPSPAPVPLPDFADPGVKAEILADELRDARAEIAREKERRQQAENRAARLETDKGNASTRTPLSNLIGKNRRRAWK